MNNEINNFIKNNLNGLAVDYLEHISYEPIFRGKTPLLSELIQIVKNYYSAHGGYSRLNYYSAHGGYSRLNYYDATLEMITKEVFQHYIDIIAQHEIHN